MEQTKIQSTEDNQTLDDLVNAVWRYEILIGISDLLEGGDGMTPQMISEDKVRFAHLIRPKVKSPRGEEMIAQWVDTDCIAFMHAVTGIDTELCGQVLSTYDGCFESMHMLTEERK